MINGSKSAPENIIALNITNWQLQKIDYSQSYSHIFFIESQFEGNI